MRSISLKTLVVATSAKPLNMEAEIGLGQRPRLDYVELSRRLGADYVDYNTPGIDHFRSVRRLEERLRLDIYRARRLARQIRQQSYDVVFSMSERIAIPLSHMLNRSVRHVVMLHHALSPAKLRLMKALETARRWDAALLFSRAEAQAFREALNLEADRVRAVHFVIDTEFYKPGEAAALNPEQDFMLSLGLSHRDYPTLIRALRTLPQVTCHISATSAWVNHRGGYENETIPSNILIKSYDHPNLIREIYTKCRFVVVPMQTHTTQWSGGSASVLQPQAMGKPVIATRTRGLADYVLDGETGLLVEGGNPAAMAEAIAYLWNNPEKAAAMGRRARQWVTENFSLDQWLDQMTDLLTNLASPVGLVPSPA